MPLLSAVLLTAGLCGGPTLARAESAGPKQYLTTISPTSSLSDREAQLAAQALSDSLNSACKGRTFFLVRASGMSMLPASPDGAWCVVENCGFESLLAGDIVNYRSRDGRIVQHRLTYKDIFGDWFVEGDNNRGHDYEAVKPRNFAGRVVAIVIPKKVTVAVR